jgi:ABC-2 type transport system permease protein
MLLLVALLLLAAFLLMVTAITYQFQGWLAALMSNPRRRRTVIVIVTTMFILISQLPNLLNFYAPWRSQQRPDRSATLAEEMAKIGRDAQAQKFTSEELDRRQQEALKNFQLANEQADRESVKNLERTARLVNTVLPVGWLPLGVMEAATGHVMPALLGLLGMTAIGTASLWRAYRTTIGMYQGQMSARKGRPAPAVATSKSTRKPANLLLEARLSGVSEPVSAIALGGLRSLMRSPEAKMMLLTPLITGAVFGSFLFKGGPDIPHSIRPLIGMAAMIVVLFGMMQLMVNQFGFDRDGFRVFVLCAARRRDILLGKNLAFAPLALGMAAILLIIVQLVCPMRIDHVLAMVPQYVTMFLLFCLLMNLLSIYAPVYIAAGSLKPSNPKLTTILIQMVMFTFIFPLTQGITLLPLGIEIMLGQLGWAESVPICLILSLALCAAVVVVYRLLLEWQGSLFQEREQKILETVTHKAA